MHMLLRMTRNGTMSKSSLLEKFAQLCETDSETAATIKATIDAASKKGGDSNSENTGPTTAVASSAERR